MKNIKSPWLLAALTTAVVAVLEAVAVLRLIPGTTVIDVGALLITGLLAGLFTGFQISARHVGRTIAPR